MGPNDADLRAEIVNSVAAALRSRSIKGRTIPALFDDDWLHEAEIAGAVIWPMLAAALAGERAALDALADCVFKATEFGEQDGGFVGTYILPTGPIHRAIPLLQEHGITVRPGFDGRAALSPTPPETAESRFAADTPDEPFDLADVLDRAAEQEPAPDSARAT